MDLYDWQAAIAAADGLRLFFDVLTVDGHLPSDMERCIVCERHENWVVVCGPEAELVSAEHCSIGGSFC